MSSSQAAEMPSACKAIKPVAPTAHLFQSKLEYTDRNRSKALNGFLTGGACGLFSSLEEKSHMTITSMTLSLHSMLIVFSDAAPHCAATVATK
jgi:hypothetical protein